MTNDDGEDGHRARLRRRQGVGRTGARFPRLAADVPDPEAADPGADREGLPELPEDAAVPAQAAPVVRSGRAAVEDATGPPQGTAVPRPSLPDDAPTAPLHLAELRNRAEGLESRVSVRPYVRTRGRTRVRADLRVETLVSVPSPRPSLEDPEHRAISDLCDGPRSVAELAALLRVPLGVARVLVDDMAGDGTLTVHPTADRLGPGRGPDAEVMARVLRGLHRL